MITAQGRTDPNQNMAFVAKLYHRGCNQISTRREAKFHNFWVGHWRNIQGLQVMKCYLGDMINPQEWSKWDDHRTVETVEYIEYLNFGPGSDIRHMVKWGGYKKNCSEEIAGQFTVSLFLPGAGHWLKTTGIPLSYGS
ncbi:hypothetical protein GBA52_022798 [Prunus armeniaca]|nr:hypothetical protein GBA52_022798 [Prunus armeniaca]